MLNYEEFKKILKADLQEELANMDVKIELLSVRKLNDQSYEGLRINFPDNAIAPILYLQDFYDFYVTIGYKKTLEKAKNAILQNNVIADADVRRNIDRMCDFSAMTDRIIFRLVNTCWNEEMLKNMPHRQFLDLSIIYYLMMGNDGTTDYSTKITNGLAARMGLNEEELYAHACVNTPQLLPLKMMGMSDFLSSFGVPDVDDMSNTFMYVIGNTAGIHGAAAILYKDVFSELSAKLNSDLYVLPSSVHEFIAIPANIGNPQELTDMIRNINETEVELQERLSDHAYYYDRRRNKLIVI